MFIYSYIYIYNFHEVSIFSTQPPEKKPEVGKRTGSPQ